MPIDYLSLQRITAMHAEEIQQAVRQVVDSGWYLQGKQNRAFEEEYSNYIGTRYCVTCANGLDALTLILRAYIEQGVMHQGDEIIVPANTYIASILAITENGLKPVLVEPDIQTLEIDETHIEEAITPRTKGLMLVHLYGRCAYTEAIAALCQRHHLKLIEDNAQAHGCTFQPSDNHGQPRKTGSLGDAAGHSFYPGKNLGALGDAGCVTTDDESLAQLVRTLANYGSSRKYVFPYRGRNSRMDELQAAVLSVKLRYLDAANSRRKTIADRYMQAVSNPLLSLPTHDRCDNVWHIFPVLTPQRDRLQQYLKENGIGTVIHYPIPPHQQDCYREWSHLSLPVTERIHNEELSIPCNEAMTDEEVTTIIELLNAFE